MKLNNIIFLNNRIRELAYTFIVKELKRVGCEKMVPSHGDILATLYKEGTLSKTEIAKRINRDRSTVTTLVQKLESLGYVKTEADKQDNRTSLVSLTKKGNEMKEDFYAISKNMHNIAFDGLSDEEIALLQKLMEKVYRNFLDKDAKI